MLPKPNLRGVDGVEGGGIGRISSPRPGLDRTAIVVALRERPKNFRPSPLSLDALDIVLGEAGDSGEEAWKGKGLEVSIHLSKGVEGRS